jgi:hypothetical protein
MSDSDWLVFESLRRRCDEVELAMDIEIRSIISEVDIDITPRFKNIETIREKLRRETMRLSQMRDIVGFRIVATGGRLRQDEIATRLCGRFQDRKVKIIDRRSNPIHNYRALHLEVEFDGTDVEIQIRTRLQHEWAEAFERLADICGRGIRYGEPLQLNHLEPLLQNLLRALFNELVTLSDVIHSYESLEYLHETAVVSHGYDLAGERGFDLVGEQHKVFRRIKELQAMLTEIRQSLD